MKRIILILIATVIMSSCVAVRNENDRANMASKTFVVGNSVYPWRYLDDNLGLNGFFYCDQNWSKLDGAIMGNAVVVAYMKVDGRFQQLPYTIYKENSDGDRWAEHIDYDYQANNITFYVTYSDFYNEYIPSSMEFRVVVMW